MLPHIVSFPPPYCCGRLTTTASLDAARLLLSIEPQQCPFTSQLTVEGKLALKQASLEALQYVEFIFESWSDDVFQLPHPQVRQ